MLEAFGMLNGDGQKEALKRLGEMLQCPEYAPTVQDGSTSEQDVSVNLEPQE